MKFSMDKKGYNTAEVDAYLEKLAENYDRILSAQKKRIEELKNALVKTDDRLKAYRDKTDIITKSIYNAVAKAEEIERLAEAKYAQEIAQLKAFHEKWTSYYNKLLARYPLSDELVNANEFNRQMRKVLDSPSASAVGIIGVEDKLIADELEKTFSDEEKRLEEKRIGYITVRTRGEADEIRADEGQDGSAFKETAFDTDSPGSLFKEEFDPVERIKQYFSADKLSKKGKEPKDAVSKIRKKRAGNDAEEVVKPVESVSSGDSPSLGSYFDLADGSAGGDYFSTLGSQSSSVRGISDDSSAPVSAQKAGAEYSDRSASGFSFEEALNPKDDLAQIMRDLGLLSDD